MTTNGMPTGLREAMRHMTERLSRDATDGGVTVQGEDDGVAFGAAVAWLEAGDPWVIGVEFDGPTSNGATLAVRAVCAERVRGRVTVAELHRLPFGKAEAAIRAVIAERTAEADAEVLGALLEPWRSRARVRTRGDYAKLAHAYESATSRGHANVLEILAKHAGTSPRVMSNRVGTARRAGYLTPAAKGRAVGTTTPKAWDDFFSTEPMEA